MCMLCACVHGNSMPCCGIFLVKLATRNHKITVTEANGKTKAYLRFLFLFCFSFFFLFKRGSIRHIVRNSIYLEMRIRLFRKMTVLFHYKN